MSLVLYSTDLNEPYPNEVWVDTDDLDQKSYHYYCKAKELGLQGTAHRILGGTITGNMIENNKEKYHKLFE